MGKHLLSHYHCRVAGVNPCGPRARRFLLENMANVVRQCTFQCFSCRFYCNTEETFLRHWRSDLHAKTLDQVFSLRYDLDLRVQWNSFRINSVYFYLVSTYLKNARRYCLVSSILCFQIAGSYRCTPCDFWCEDNETMEAHLVDSSHRDVVSMMNGSVPIRIGRQRALTCGGCDRRFRYNLQLRLHIKETGHEESLTATDEYQQRIKCNLCPQIVRSLVALQRHQLSSHVTKIEKHETNDSSQPTPYFCSFCSMNFATAREAVLHRRTSSHKEMVKARKSNEGPSTSTVRQCPHCKQKQTNLSEHKTHLLDSHPELCYR